MTSSEKEQDRLETLIKLLHRHQFFFLYMSIVMTLALILVVAGE